MSRKRARVDPAVAALLPGLEVVDCVQVAALWSSYGHIYRVTVRKDDGNVSMILKHIHPPHTEHASLSHARKLLSYSVERSFYDRFAPRLPATVAVAKRHPTSAPGTLLLDDLSPSFPRGVYGNLNLEDTRTALLWLAGFHATFWGEQGSVLPPVADMPIRDDDSHTGVWQQGTYWYLDTRREELAQVEEDGEGGFVLPWVEKVNDALSAERTSGRCTLLHGDVKGENIIFAPDGRVAFYDFQYVGSGSPALDVVSLLGTSVQGRLLHGHGESELLRIYFDALAQNLPDNVHYPWKAFATAMELAIVDWCRFMAGWGFWGNDRWVLRRAREIVQGWNDGGFDAAA
ncbi:hypothetical protein EXIGLDRAFT_834493 [Exidia glandulosa HHB12029]|uniref:CHK kinase-like domain-containing protein n=1 Tax=Exidia glandulosa HHB12029 TaxID=1314781 RepID=A0A166ATR8_EXIGL|nr:hypothetical protein EXIGLDRAFT_834493 [Exidia glandulosa HHB12029]